MNDSQLPDSSIRGIKVSWGHLGAGGPSSHGASLAVFQEKELAEAGIEPVTSTM